VQNGVKVQKKSGEECEKLLLGFIKRFGATDVAYTNQIDNAIKQQFF